MATSLTFQTLSGSRRYRGPLKKTGVIGEVMVPMVRPCLEVFFVAWGG